MYARIIMSEVVEEFVGTCGRVSPKLWKSFAKLRMRNAGFFRNCDIILVEDKNMLFQQKEQPHEKRITRPTRCNCNSR